MMRCWLDYPRGPQLLIFDPRICFASDRKRGGGGGGFGQWGVNRGGDAVRFKKGRAIARRQLL